MLATLYGRDVKTIGKHVASARREELAGIPVVANFATTAADGRTYQVERYDLDMILSVGYRVKSPEIAGVASVPQVYAEGLALLDDYDHQRLLSHPICRRTRPAQTTQPPRMGQWWGLRVSGSA
jgi:hypothetical protein